ncbi:MAG: radical SAM protein [Polyangiaceae bacterium]
MTALDTPCDPVEALRRLAAEPAEHSLWRDALTRYLRFQDLLGQPRPAAAGSSRQALIRLVRTIEALPARFLGGASPAQAIADISRMAASVPAEAQAALLGTLVAALSPIEALDLVSTDALFSEAELELIAQLKALLPAARRRLPTFQWAGGKDVDYEGYVCTIVKVTRQCNLRCGYCSDWRSGPEAKMKFEVIAQTIARILGCASHNRVDFVWHGGEPTLIGRRDFLRILSLQRRFMAAGQRLDNILQTNATAITEEWAMFLSDFGFSVSVSLDGPAEIHDRARPMASGFSSYRAVRKGLALLQRHQLAEGVLMVVGDEVLGMGAERLLRFFQEEGLTKVALLAQRPANPPTASSDYLSPRRYATFLVDMHRARLASPGPWVALREVDNLLELFRGKMPSLCEHLGNCVGHYFSVEPNGDVGHCDKYSGDPEYTLGNVMQDSFDEIRASSRVTRLRDEAERSREPMKTCRHYDKCRGWCPHERYVAKRVQLGVAGKCCGLGPMFDALEQLEAPAAREHATEGLLTNTINA